MPRNILYPNPRRAFRGNFVTHLIVMVLFVIAILGGMCIIDVIFPTPAHATRNLTDDGGANYYDLNGLLFDNEEPQQQFQQPQQQFQQPQQQFQQPQQQFQQPQQQFQQPQQLHQQPQQLHQQPQQLHQQPQQQFQQQQLELPRHEGFGEEEKIGGWWFEEEKFEEEKFE